jgi:DinB family.
MTKTPVVQGNIEAVNQCLRFLARISSEQFTCVHRPIMSNSIGCHFRHILDMYRALITAMDNLHEGGPAIVDYDIRRRNAACEGELQLAKNELVEVLAWLQGLDISDQKSCCTVRTEVTAEETYSAEFASGMVRELVFVASHTVHHLAIISIAARLQGVPVEECLGVAPATVTFLKAQTS